MPATFDGGKMNGSAFVNGMSIHPESSNNFEVTANASLGLKQVRYTIKCGNQELKSDNVELSYIVITLLSVVPGAGAISLWFHREPVWVDES